MDCDYPITKRLTISQIKNSVTYKDFKATGVIFEVKPYPAKDSKTFALWRPYDLVQALCTNEAAGYDGNIAPYKYRDMEQKREPILLL